MDIKSLYGLSDAQYEFYLLSQQKQDQEATKAANTKFIANTATQAGKMYIKEQGIKTKELLSEEYTSPTGEKFNAYEYNPEYTDMNFFDPRKLFAPSDNRVQPTQGYVNQASKINRPQSIPLSNNISPIDIEPIPSSPSITNPLPSIDPISSIDPIASSTIGITSTAPPITAQSLKGVDAASKYASTAAPIEAAESVITEGAKMGTKEMLNVGGKVAGGVSTLLGVKEMTEPEFKNKKAGYKAATAFQTILGGLSLIPGLQSLSLLSGGLGLLKGKG